MALKGAMILAACRVKWDPVREGNAVSENITHKPFENSYASSVMIRNFSKPG